MSTVQGRLRIAIQKSGRLSERSLDLVRDAGLRPELPEAERIRLYSGHSLRAGLASSAEVDERYVQKQLGHARDQFPSYCAHQMPSLLRGATFCRASPIYQAP